MFSSKRRIGTAVACAAFASVAVPAASMAAVKVNLRVEGSTKTIFDRTVRAAPGKLRSNLGPSRGRYPCNLVNNGGVGRPSATPTSALAQSGLKVGLSWSAKYSEFMVESISREAPDAEATGLYWDYFINGESGASFGVGGCQRALKGGDSLVWAVTNGADRLLSLRQSGDSGSPEVSLRVTDAKTGSPVEGATLQGAEVNGPLTGADGRAVVARPASGVRGVWASKAGAIRSNSVLVRARR